MTLPANLNHLTADELRELVRQQAEVITRNDRELNWRQAKIDKLTHEVAYYKRHYFGVKAERLPVEQGQLFEETLAADMAAITEELEQVSEPKTQGPSEAHPVAAGTTAHRDSPRTGINDLRLWLPTETYR
jgi:transposase